MSRGRKPKLPIPELNWQQLFYKNVGTYLQTIIIELGKINEIKKETSEGLLLQIKDLRRQRILQGNLTKGKEYPEIKASEIPYKIPNNWTWCRLGEVIEFTQNLNIENNLSADTLINYVDIDAIDNQKYQIRDSKLKTVAELSSRSRRVLKSGFIVYSLVRPYLNNTAIIKEEKPNYIGSTGFAVFSGILIDNKFIQYFLLTNYVNKLFLGMLSGFNSPSISLDQFTSTLFPLPPLSEQKEIIMFLNDFEINKAKEGFQYFNYNIENRVSNLHKAQISASRLLIEFSNQHELLIKLRDSFLQRAIQGKLVDRVPKEGLGVDLLKKIKLEKKIFDGKKSQGIEVSANLSGKIIPPFQLPSHWSWCKLCDVTLKIHYGLNTSARPEKNDVRLLRITDIQDNRVDCDNVPGCNYSNGDLEKYLLNNNDIVIARTGGTIGKTYLIKNIPVKSLFASYLIRAIPSKLISPEFIKLYMESPFYWMQIYDAARGAGQPNVNGTSLSNLWFPLPPFLEQIRIVNEINILVKQCDELQNRFNKNKELVQKLLAITLSEAVGEKLFEEKKKLEPQNKRTKIKEPDFKTTIMEIIEILQTSKSPLAANVVWQRSEYRNDIEKFYAELKKLIDIDKLVIEEKKRNGFFS